MPRVNEAVLTHALVPLERSLGFSQSRRSRENELGEQSSAYDDLTLLANPMAGFIRA